MKYQKNPIVWALFALMVVGLFGSCHAERCPSYDARNFKVRGKGMRKHIKCNSYGALDPIPKDNSVIERV